MLPILRPSLGVASTVIGQRAGLAAIVGTRALAVASAAFRAPRVRLSTALSTTGPGASQTPRSVLHHNKPPSSQQQQFRAYQRHVTSPSPSPRLYSGTPTPTPWRSTTTARIPPINTGPPPWTRSRTRVGQQHQHEQRRFASGGPDWWNRSFNERADPYGVHRRYADPLFTNDDLKRAARHQNTKYFAVFCVVGTVIFYFMNLETVPVSGRTRFNIYSRKRVNEAGDLSYRQLLYDLGRQGVGLLPEWDYRTQRVKRVMAKLIPFSGMRDENWEIYVIDNPHKANAFVLPGGKVFVFSGILNLARTDSQLATVLGHEIAHNVADHVGERMSQNIGLNILMYSMMVLGGFIGPGALVAQLGGAWILNAVVEKPMSRKQESEADYIGLMMMAEACYDPREAVTFWERMDRRTKGNEVPEWMSTHPSHSNRIEKIQQWIPEALEKRERSDCRTTASFADLFRQALLNGIVEIRQY
ncbi:peptidase family M48-domain-containing protein [Sordaria brevicollis]|uniref:Peptidase family M48-domain-containing protein n=1 Tax=Sordaria brevicollis TaxID=83679 RepID=A0AAE0UHR2_SORBR|nr:peptidase family M48-domain-containing protein [Sordaria brevicollis]